LPCCGAEQTEGEDFGQHQRRERCGLVRMLANHPLKDAAGDGAEVIGGHGSKVGFDWPAC
jgi:hypothetical protein